jgi:hypothetical protein
MSGTGSRAVTVALLVAVDATLLWTGVVLVGPDVVVPLLVAVAAGTVATLAIGGSFRARERAAWAAIREHRDPGPEVRPEADAQARKLLGSPAVDRWGPPVLLSGLAVACVVTALVRGDLFVAFPAPVLLALAVVSVVLRRRLEAEAERWVTDPPVPTEEAQP